MLGSGTNPSVRTFYMSECPFVHPLRCGVHWGPTFWLIALIPCNPHDTIIGKNLFILHKLITKGMLPISFSYTKWAISQIPASQETNLKLKYLCLAHGKYLDLAHQ